MKVEQSKWETKIRNLEILPWRIHLPDELRIFIIIHLPCLIPLAPHQEQRPQTLKSKSGKKNGANDEMDRSIDSPIRRDEERLNGSKEGKERRLFLCRIRKRKQRRAWKLKPFKTALLQPHCSGRGPFASPRIYSGSVAPTWKLPIGSTYVVANDVAARHE